MHSPERARQDSLLRWRIDPFERTEDLLTYAALAGSGIAVAACVTTVGGCVLTAGAAAGWVVIEKYQTASTVGRVLLRAYPNNLDRIVVNPSTGLIPADGSEPLAVEGVFKSALATGEGIKELASRALAETVATAVKKFTRVPNRPKDRSGLGFELLGRLFARDSRSSPKFVEIDFRGR